METDPEPASTEPSDTLLAQLLADLESDDHAVVERVRQLPPALAQRVMALVERLRNADLLREPVRIGRFVLAEPLGRGAMGIVWKARDVTLARDVALKLVAAHLLARPTAVERFRREARVIAGLRHPGIVTVHEVGEEQGAPFLVMELVDGGSLADRVGAADFTAPDAAEVCRMGVLLCEGLQCAHDAAIVHRDIKPSNVLLRSSGAALLGDFGLAGVAGDPSLTKTGDLLGTPAYAAPEMLESGRADARSDVYSLGATLFCALTGRPPFDEGSVQALVRRATTSEAPRLRSIRADLSIDLDSVLGRALERDPARRYATARELGEDLGRLLRGEPVRARRVGRAQRLVRWARRRPAAAAAVAVPLTMAVTFVVGFVWWQSVELRRYEQLADVRVVDKLLAEVADLWPALPATVPRMQSWLERARAVLDRADLHRRAKDRVAAASRGTIDGEPVFDSEALAWQHDVLQALDAAIDRLGPVVPIVERRTEFAQTVGEQTVFGSPARAAWAQARAAIRQSERYHGLTLGPQFGLLPLGEDPKSGLWEFWHPLTGERPQPSAPGSPSRWNIKAETGVVFVLVPGGTYTLGGRAPSAAHPVGSPFVDAGVFAIPPMLEQIELRPFFLAKYEMTQTQWERMVGSQPSQFDHGLALPYPILPTCPVESVSWDDVSRMVSNTGLILPTDAQWEAAYRSGTSTVYPHGNNVESMFGTENVLDRSWERADKNTLPDVEPFDDGFPALAPVGSFPPSGFGLHDMGGNVGELCRDAWNGVGTRTRSGDGLLGSSTGLTRFRLVRGASWSEGFARSRSALRSAILSDRRSSSVGVRVARDLVDWTDSR